MMLDSKSYFGGEYRAWNEFYKKRKMINWDKTLHHKKYHFTQDRWEQQKNIYEENKWSESKRVINVFEWIEN